jgi:hypothetical protein
VGALELDVGGYWARHGHVVPALLTSDGRPGEATSKAADDPVTSRGQGELRALPALPRFDKVQLVKGERRRLQDPRAG